jgi:hypothetical protein
MRTGSDWAAPRTGTKRMAVRATRRTSGWMAAEGRERERVIMEWFS